MQYRVHQGLSHTSAAMAVIVQEMIPAETAGVLFTADPTTRDRSRIVIEGALGRPDRRGSRIPGHPPNYIGF